jgi:hypothetical protein
MALISVSELLLDPDFVDTCTVMRMIETVGQDGISYRRVVPIQILASIQAASGDELVMTPDAARTSASYECITTFPLNEATETAAADEVLWQGMTFTVVTVSRFGNFSGNRGHYEAVMALQPVRTRATEGMWDRGQTIWDDGATVWDAAGNQGSPATTAWDAAATTWQDGTESTVWDVEPSQ